MKLLFNILRNYYHFCLLVTFLNFKLCRVFEGFVDYDVISSYTPTLRSIYLSLYFLLE